MEDSAVIPRSVDEADLVILDGKIWSTEYPDASAIASRAGKIVAMGPNCIVEQYIGVHTEVINAHSKRVLPGFIDVHTHLDMIADFLFRQIDIQIPPCKDLDEGMKKIAGECSRAGPGVWVVAIAGVRRPIPSKAQLDEISPQNPVIIIESAHIQYLNTLALAAAKIDRDTKPPEDGIIERDEYGDLTGKIQEALNLWQGCIPDETYEVRKTNVLKLLKEFASYGVTSVADFPLARSMKIYQDLKDDGELPTRLRLNFFVSGKNANEPADDHSTTLMAYPVIDSYDNILSEFGPRTGFGDEWIKFGAVKIFLDGDNDAAAHYEDHNKRDEWVGNLKLNQEELNAIVEKAHRGGWQILIHAAGDKAQDMCFEAIERAQKNWPREDIRHRIEHLGLNEAGPVTPTMLQRAKNLNIIPLITGGKP